MRTTAGIATTILLLACASAPLWAATAKLPAPVRTGPAADVVVPVVIDPASNVSSITMSFAFDEAIVEPMAVYRTAATMGWTLTADLGVTGQVSLTLESEDALAGGGPVEVAWILFQVVGPAGSNSNLEWIDAELNAGGIAVVTQDGQVQVLTAQRVIAVSDDLQGVPGTPLMIPITATNVAGAKAFDLVLRYNPEVLNAVSVAKTSLTNPMAIASYLGFPGEVRVALWSVNALPAGAGPLVQVSFDTTGVFDDATPLDMTKGVINDGAITASLDDGLLVLCDPVDVDNDGFSGCAGDCDNTRNDINPNGMEICDGLDNDCNDAVDDGIPVPIGFPGLVLDRDAGDVLLDWSGIGGASGYDVIKGDLSVLRSSDGDFTAATEECLADDMAGTSFEDATPTGAALWYLVRAVNCGGGGTYDSPGPAQFGLRDAEISASSDDCP